MNKMKLLKIVNPILAILFVVQVGTILAILFLDSVLDFENFVLIHKWVGATLVCVVFLHIYLNWSWIKSNIFPKRKA